MTIAPKAICGFLAAAIAFAPSIGVKAATTDPDAGTWRMIVLTGPTQVPVPLPSQVTSLEYQAELASIRSPKPAHQGAAPQHRLLEGAAACCAGTS